MSVLDKDLQPVAMYSDVYKSGTVYFQTHSIVAESGQEIPFVKNIHDFLSDEHVDLRFFDISVNEHTVEQLILENLVSMFHTDMMSIQPAVRLPYSNHEEYDQFIVTLVNGKYNDHPVYTVQVTLEKKNV